MKKIIILFMLFCLGTKAQVKSIAVPVLAAQIQSGFSTPIDIGVSLSSGEAIEIISASCDWSANTTPYTSLFFYLWTDFAPSFQFYDGGFCLSSGTNQFVKLTPQGFASNSIVINQHVFIRTDSDSFSGDGTGIFYITYRILGAPPKVPIFDTIITLTSSEILALNTTPVTLIASPGINKTIELVSVTDKLIFNTTAYAGHQTLIVTTATASGPQVVCTVLNENANCKHLAPVTTPGATTQIIPNQPLIATTQSGNPTTGDSSIELHIYYRIVDY